MALIYRNPQPLNLGWAYYLLFEVKYSQEGNIYRIVSVFGVSMQNPKCVLESCYSLLSLIQSRIQKYRVEGVLQLLWAKTEMSFYYLPGIRDLQTFTFQCSISSIRQRSRNISAIIRAQ